MIHLEPRRWYTLPEQDAGLVLDGAFYNNLPVFDDFYALFIYGNPYEYFTGTTVSIEFLFHSHSICHETTPFSDTKLSLNFSLVFKVCRLDSERPYKSSLLHSKITKLFIIASTLVFKQSVEGKLSEDGSPSESEPSFFFLNVSSLLG